ncbi:geranyl transferase [Rhodanobacter thiooxydans]|uniref:Geranyl transferase n=1 Tax=Rhodanobacter thiooxydans TaxID=416169 RepID=A0A154QJD6_9GAMM|nr:farnesyl diphosphate synthase [Rhodanobacter thiooxydans]EIL97895.1 farnesyl-diphosphate synthase [Rhodanobacter thiooxydans LCS2]KZC23856.1 geranyl transferase [Rhodanobacter thiooxydans]MCW0202284.1 polyprenyl synthetase family protein [Rhodanobacter thiooxydans]
MNPNSELGPALQSLIERAEQALDRHLPPAGQSPTELHRAMRYAVLGGGKRLRPLLVYATAHALGEDGPQLDAAACAVELIHAYSLVHDDLPAMDDDALRRGRPTCHVVFGEAMAILAGDALQALAFGILAEDAARRTDAATGIAMLRALGHACGAEGMAGGQALDLAAVGQTLTLGELEHMHACKTGALIRASVQLGALAAGTDEGTLQALDRYAHAVGLAFQVRDDILDVEGESAVIGKTAGKDAAAAKPTFPSIIGLDASRARLAELTDTALAAFAPLGDRAVLLEELARYAAHRRY